MQFYFVIASIMEIYESTLQDYYNRIQKNPQDV